MCLRPFFVFPISYLILFLCPLRTAVLLFIWACLCVVFCPAIIIAQVFIIIASAIATGECCASGRHCRGWGGGHWGAFGGDWADCSFLEINVAYGKDSSSVQNTKWIPLLADGENGHRLFSILIFMARKTHNYLFLC